MLAIERRSDDVTKTKLIDWHVRKGQGEKKVLNKLKKSVCIFDAGNYGNKLDQSVPPSSSTTPPTNAVYDGCYYYYLPWGDTKPCVCVDSHWEDISFRLDNLNILTRLCERLVSIKKHKRIRLLGLCPPNFAFLIKTVQS